MGVQESEIEKLSITRGEYSALNLIRGLDASAFHLVVGAQPDKSGRYILEGPAESFDLLANDVAQEIDYKMSPPSRLKHLTKLYKRLMPDSDEF